MTEANMLVEQTLRWVQRRQVNDDRSPGYVFSASASEPTILSLCFATLTAELHGVLPQHEVESWRHMLLSVQDPETGYFFDPLLSPVDLEPTSPGQEDLLHQTTYFALNALDALGSRPRHVLCFVEAYCDPAAIERWLDGLDWSDPGKESSWVMFVAAGLYCAWQWEGSRPAFDALHHLLDWPDAHQDPATGNWGLADGVSLLDAMAGAYPYLPLNFCLGRMVHFPEQMIESTLSLQQSNGLFHPDGAADTCLDVDAAASARFSFPWEAKTPSGCTRRPIPRVRVWSKRPGSPLTFSPRLSRRAVRSLHSHAFPHIRSGVLVDHLGMGARQPRHLATCAGQQGNESGRKST